MDVPESVVWFGPYRLTARIATGGMAEVYLGRKKGADGLLGPTVAVKRLLPHLASDTAVVRMFLNEARITAQIEHPNVVRILDLGQEGREPFIAMELLEGRSLADLRQAAAETAQRIPLGVTLRVLADACRGLDAAHRAVDENGRQLCIVHRDFSPDNIHVGVDGKVKVIDFGIATATNMNSGTEPGILKGKFFYMSPEMISGAPLDHRADLFAAGVMLYEQLCGRRPFTGISTDEVLTRIAEGRPRRPSAFDPSVPPVLEAICLTALAHHPEGRFPSLKEFIDSLESVGTITPLAEPLEVAEYVERMFPEERDPQRQALRRAKQRDPSVPHSGLDVQPTVVAPSSPAVAAAPAARAGRFRNVVPFAAGALAVTLVASLVWWSPWKRPPAPVVSAEVQRREIETQLGPQPERALELAKTFVASHPQDTAGLLLEARAYMALRQGKRADAALDRASALSPQDPTPDLVRAQLREMQGDPGGALDALAAAQKKQPGDRSLQRQRALLLSQAGRLDDAAAALSALLQRRFDPEVAAELAFVKLRQAKPGDDLKEAVALLRHSLRKKPKLAAAQYYLGSALALQGDKEGAERAYREAIALDPADPRPLGALCQLQAKNGRSADAQATRALLSTRFPAQSAALIAECRP